MRYDTPINATDTTFDHAVLQPATPVVAVFWSSDTTPGDKLDAVLEQAARPYSGEVLIVKLETEDAPAAMARYTVDRLPQFLFFRNGKLVARPSGMPTIDALRPWIEYLLNRGPRPAVEQGKAPGRRQTGGRPLVVTDADFDRIVLNAEVPVMVDFWASWCGVCRSLAPVVGDLARSFAGRALIAKVDVEANESTARRYTVGSIPTVIFFRNGQEVDRMVSAQPKHVLARKLEALV